MIIQDVTISQSNFLQEDNLKPNLVVSDRCQFLHEYIDINVACLGLGMRPFNLRYKMYNKRSISCMVSDKSRPNR